MIDSEIGDGAKGLSRSDAPRAAALAVGAFVFYAIYAAREPIFGDGMELVAAAAVGGVAHPPGYPTLTTLLAPFARGESAYFQSTLVCAAFVALAVGVLRLLIGSLAREFVRIDDKRMAIASDLLVIAFALSFSFLDAATVVEVYALNALFLAGILALLVPRPAMPLGPAVLIAASLLQGLAVTNHLTSLCTGPLLAWRVVQAILATPRLAALLVPATAAAFAVGLLPYLLMPLRAASSPPINWGNPQSMEQMSWMLRGGEYRDGQFLRVAPGRLFTIDTWIPFATVRTLDMLRSLGGQYLGGMQPGRPVAGLVVGIAGLGFVFAAAIGFLRWWRENRMTAAALLLATLLQAGFILLYNIPDIEDYHLGILITLIPFLCTGGFILLFEKWSDSVPTLLTAQRHTIVPGFLAVAALISSPPLYRANIVVGAVWIDRVLEVAPPDAMILTHSDYDIYPIWYAQHSQGRRPDILVVGTNFLRYEWYERMMPPHRPDPAGRSVSATPGHFTEFTLESHVEALRTGVIEPNLGRVPILVTDLDPFAVRELGRHYRLVPLTRLMTDEEYALFEHAPSAPPSMLLEIHPRDGAGNSP